MRRYLWVAASLIVILGMLVACGAPAPAPTSEPAETAPTTAPATEPTAEPEPAAEKVTLTVWDELTGEAEQVMEAMLARYTDAHPNVEVKREVHSIDEMRDIISTALSSGTGPDLFVYDAGPASAGVLARAGLLLPLDDAYEEFGWNDRVFEWTKSRVSTDGKIYGMADSAGFLGVYYNKEIFAELGVEPPTTMDELETIADKAKAAGYIPISWANKPGWPASNIFSELVNNALGCEEMDKLMWEQGSWDRPEVVDVVDKFFVEYEKSGYFPPGVNGIGYPEGNELFWQGNAAMYPTGSWLMRQMSQQEFDVGFFFWPEIDGGFCPPGGVDSAYFVSAKSAHPDETLELLHWMFEPEQLPTWLEVDRMPPMDLTAAAQEADVPPLQQFAIDLMAKVSQEGGLGYNIDVVTPAKFNDVMYTGFQAVLSGDKTPEQQVKDMQEAWEAAIAAGEVQTR